MTRVCFFMRDGLFCGMESRGHSGYAEEGSDIVCAAVSTAMSVAECYLTDICRYDTAVETDDEPRISVRLRSGSAQARRDCDRILRAVRMTLEENTRGCEAWIRISDAPESGKKI
ncbi:MAG: ribosomal-processing cysteine protease Prp [Clostridiales bacterium]|nr:ribosomal-processing cysteine protease Prp [Clostridiales bacterium]